MLRLLLFLRGVVKKGSLDAAECEFHQSEYTRLLAVLENAEGESQLPNEPSARDA